METAFKHEVNQELKDKALHKYEKMIATEKGKKFFEHLAKAFYLDDDGDDTFIETIKTSESPNGLFTCDLTGAKLISEEMMEKYKITYNLKVQAFLRNEGESDEEFNLRLDMYKDALRSSNPYAVDCCLGYKSPKSDKIICYEAYLSIMDMVCTIMNNPEQYPELSDILDYKKIQEKKEAARKMHEKQKENRKKYKEWLERKKQKEENKNKPAPRKSKGNNKVVYATSGNSVTTLGDLDALKSLKLKMKKK